MRNPEDTKYVWDEENFKIVQNSMKTNKTLNELQSYKNSNVTSFIKEVQDICRKYQISISHEDSHGSFILTDYNDLYIDYLNDAINETTTNKKKQTK